MTDTLFANKKSFNQNECAQVYSHKCCFSAVCQLLREKGDSIGQFGYGVPDNLIFDVATDQIYKNTLFMKCINKYVSNYHVSASRMPNDNPEEASAREVKHIWYRIMHKKKVPHRIWDYGIVWVC